MKSARFILNSDYTTVRNTGVAEITLTIPDSFSPPYIDPQGGTIPYQTIASGTAEMGNASDSIFIYYTSSRYDYITTGWFGETKPDGARVISSVSGEVDYHSVYIDVYVTGAHVEIKVRAMGPSSSNETLTYTGFGQTITAHILTFKDPFSE